MADAHLAALEAKHAGLEARIEAEIQRPDRDNIGIVQLKKEKLRLKDEIRTR